LSFWHYFSSVRFRRALLLMIAMGSLIFVFGAEDAPVFARARARGRASAAAPVREHQVFAATQTILKRATAIKY
jgi:hypothetical protein